MAYKTIPWVTFMCIFWCSSCTENTAESSDLETTQVVLNKTDITLKKDENEQLEARLLPSDVLTTKVSWHSKNTFVATVTSNGLVTAKEAGSTFVIVTTYTDKKTDTCKVTVELPPIYIQKITLNCFTNTLRVGDKKKLQATLYPDNATHKNIIWVSHNENVCTISQTGEVTALAIGEAIIIVTSEAGSKSAYCTITVE